MNDQVDQAEIPLEEHADETDQTFRKMLRVQLTDAEHAAKGEDLGKVQGEIEALEEEAKEIRDSLKVRRDKLKKRLTTLAYDARTGTEERPVVCEEVRDFERNIVFIRRTDTGETIEERAMDARERQLELDAAAPDEAEGEPEADPAAEAEGDDGAEPGEVKTSSAEVKRRKKARQTQEEAPAEA